MPKIVVSGYFGFHNSGDEAMLHAMIKALKKRLPNIELVVLSEDPQFTAKSFGVRSIPRKDPGKIWRELKDADLLISGGGGLLQDITGPLSIVYYLGIVLMAKVLCKPVVFYAQGIGPVRTGMGKLMIKLVGNRVDLITVRDADSRLELLDLGVNKPPVYVTADPVLGLDPGEIDRWAGRKILVEKGLGRRPLVGISVRCWQGLRDYKRVVARAADELAEKGWDVVLVPMHYPADLKACREVAALMKKNSVLLDKYCDFRELLAVVANMDLVIGMRLHFLIFGAVMNVPLVGISYDPKVGRFLELVRQPLAGDVHSLDYSGLNNAVNKVLADRRAVTAALERRVASLREEALKNADYVAEFLVKHVK